LKDIIISKSENKDFFRRCIEQLPLSLALIRSLECKQFDMFEYNRPILDLGCGDGLFSKILFSEKTDCGLDITFKFLQNAKEKGAFQYGLQSDATILPFKNDSFNSVISNCVIEHIPDVDKLFTEVHRILKPGGIFVITTHTHQYNDFLYYSNLFYSLKLKSLGKWYEKFINSVFKHINCLHPDVWTNKLEKAGLMVKHKSYYYGHPVQKVFDFLVPFTFFRFILWKFTGKWFLSGRNFLAPIQYRLFKRLYDENPDLSCAIVIKSVKE
jgi:SAM-dependent methyltransferase